MTRSPRPSLQEALVVPHHQLAVDLLHRLEGDADRDQDRRAGEREVLHVGEGEEHRRQQGDEGDEERAGERDAAEDAGEVPLGLGSGPDAGDEAALLADVLRLLGGVERDGRVEVREADDQQAVDHHVGDRVGLHEVVVDPGADGVAPPARRQHVGEQDRQVEHRAGEDDRDHAALVHLERDVGALAAVHAPAHHPLGELHRDAPLALLDEHDGDQQHDRQGEQCDEERRALLGVEPGAGAGERAHDRGEDQQRHAVADAALADELAHPHEQRGAGGEREHHDDHRERREVRQDVEAGGVATATEQPTAAVVEQERQAGGLQQRDGHRQVAGPLGDLALPHRAHLLPLLQLRDHHGEDLHDDRRRDVRHDPEGEDGELGERAAGEQLEEAHHATAALGLALQLLDGVEVDARRRHVGAHPVQGDDEQREEDLPPEVGDPEDVPDARQHGEGSWSAAGRRPRSVSGWRTGCPARGDAGRPRAWAGPQPYRRRR